MSDAGFPPLPETSAFDPFGYTARQMHAYARAARAGQWEWQPIETAPKDNNRPLFLAHFNEAGRLTGFDYNGSWESESESWEIPQVYYYWASEHGNVEEPTHWMYQPKGFDRLGVV